MKGCKRQVVFVIEVAILLAVTVVIGLLRGEWQKSVPEGNGLPLIEINLNGVSLDEIKASNRTTRYSGNQLSVSEKGVRSNYSDVELKGRGNSTWSASKKPFQIRFDKKVDLLGMGKARKWVLLANYFDASSLRNDTALYLAEMLGLNYTKTGRFVELAVDGEYQGVYYVTHKVEIGKNMVDLRNSAGVLVELDNFRNDERACFQTVRGDCLKERGVVEEELKDAAMEDFVADYNRLELAAAARDYATVEELIDVKSFAQYFLLSEFTVNPDAYTSSYYMYKDGVDDKIHAGPGWDFDFALGNRLWQWTELDSFHAPDQDMIREIEAMGGQFVANGKIVEKDPDLAISRLYYELMKMAEFQNVVREVFEERMAGRKLELLQHIEWQAGAIYAAMLENNKVWQNEDFREETQYLLGWVAQRYEHFEKTYGNDDKKYVINL